MKVLLIGEYSRLNNSLKEGLLANNHTIIIIGKGDGFKKFPIDINIEPKTIERFFILDKFRHLVYFITKIDLGIVESLFRFYTNRRKIVNYDVVQLINEFPFKTTPFIDKLLLKYIFKNNKRVFLSACGNDYIYTSYSLSGKFSFSTFSPLLNDTALKKHYKHSLRYVTKKHKKLHDYVFNHIKAVIPASVEYDIAYQNIPKKSSLIPNAVNIDKIKYTPLSVQGKIKILHGVNTGNYIKKGNGYFDEALNIIKQKYSHKIEIITTKDLPYDKYIKYFLSAHILLDQAQAHDQGYNALEAMAMGKVVFTGAGEAFRNHYNLKHTVAIDTYPDSTKIAENLEKLILNPSLITEISKNARDFIEKEHNYILIAKKYEETWLSYD